MRWVGLVAVLVIPGCGATGQSSTTQETSSVPPASGSVQGGETIAGPSADQGPGADAGRTPFLAIRPATAGQLEPFTLAELESALLSRSDFGPGWSFDRTSEETIWACDQDRLVGTLSHTPWHAYLGPGDTAASLRLIQAADAEAAVALVDASADAVARCGDRRHTASNGNEITFEPSASSTGLSRAIVRVHEPGAADPFFEAYLTYRQVGPMVVVVQFGRVGVREPGDEAYFGNLVAQAVESTRSGLALS